MARSDLLVNMVRAAWKGNLHRFRDRLEDFIAAERAANHFPLAQRLQHIMEQPQRDWQRQAAPPHLTPAFAQALHQTGRMLVQVTLRRLLANLILTGDNGDCVAALIREHSAR